MTETVDTMPSELFYELEGVISDLQSGVKQPDKPDINTLQKVQVAVDTLLAEREELMKSLKKARKLYFIGQALGEAEALNNEEEETRLEEKGHALLTEVDALLTRLES